MKFCSAPLRGGSPRCLVFTSVPSDLPSDCKVSGIRFWLVVS
jgi:hypothetical protein